MAEKRKLSDEEREQRPAQDHERLMEAAEQLLTSEGWQRGVRVRARGGLARLSLNNQLLVALSRPDATFVAGFKAWLKLGYCVIVRTRLTQARQRQGLSLRAVADATDISAATLSRFESHKGNPDLIAPRDSEDHEQPVDHGFCWRRESHPATGTRGARRCAAAGGQPVPVPHHGCPRAPCLI